MALVKKSKIAAQTKKAEPPASPPSGHTPLPIAPRVSPARPQTVIERVAAATEELAAGLVEASAATKELSLSMQQIAAGAEEAAGASQEQSAALKLIVGSLATARAEADQSGRRSETYRMAPTAPADLMSLALITPAA